MMNLLLLSNSTIVGQPYLEWPREYIKSFLGGISRVTFIPYAAVSFSYDEYEAMVAKALEEIDLEVKSIHHAADPKEAIQHAEAIMVGGGNTFHLLHKLQSLELVEPIRAKVKEGMPYIGWSAGANMACPTIRTTNDMPIIEPKSFDALDLVPYQINPHYTERTVPGHGGESRLQRLKEYAAINTRNVVCLPEGCGIQVSQGKTRLLSAEPVKVVKPQGEYMTLHPGLVTIE